MNSPLTVNIALTISIVCLHRNDSNTSQVLQFLSESLTDALESFEVVGLCYQTSPFYDLTSQLYHFTRVTQRQVESFGISKTTLDRSQICSPSPYVSIGRVVQLALALPLLLPNQSPCPETHSFHSSLSPDHNMSLYLLRRPSSTTVSSLRPPFLNDVPLATSPK